MAVPAAAAVVRGTIKAPGASYPVAAAEEWRTTVDLAWVPTPDQARNQIPAQAETEAWLDIRFPPEDPQFNRRSAPEVAAYLQGFCEPGVTAVVESLDAPHHTDPDRPEIGKIRAAALRRGSSPISCASAAWATAAFTDPGQAGPTGDAI